VCWEYRVRLLSVLTGLTTERAAQRFVLNIAIAFMPLAVLGLAFGKVIKAHLFQPVPVALAFIVGGFIILWAERRKHEITVQTVDDMGWRDALKLGADSRYLALGRYHHRRPVFRTVTQGLDRVLVFSGDSDLVCGQRLSAVQGAGLAVGR
jgi:hypothetical protein